jgi:hypothetical protein
MIPLQFYLDDDPIGDVKLARSVPSIGEGMTLEFIDRVPTARYRVVDVDRGYVQANPRSTTFKESTVAVYLIGADDPRREGITP